METENVLKLMLLRSLFSLSLFSIPKTSSHINNIQSNIRIKDKKRKQKQKRIISLFAIYTYIYAYATIAISKYII